MNDSLDPPCRGTNIAIRQMVLPATIGIRPMGNAGFNTGLSVAAHSRADARLAAVGWVGTIAAGAMLWLALAWSTGADRLV